MNIKELKKQGLELFSTVKEQVVNFVDEELPKAQEFCTQAKNAVADAVTKRARKGAQITLESDLKGHYKITVAGSKAAVRNAFEKLLKEEWLCK